MPAIEDKELQLYRDLVDEPEKFEEGFGLKTLIGALFLGFVMLPGSIYLALVMGAGLGPAARWVTLILFAEVAKRSMKSMRQQEVFILFYMTGIALGGQLHGGFMTQMLWNQYLVQSPSMQSMGIEVPWWVAPDAASLEAHGRTFFTADWMVVIAFMSGTLLIARIDQFGLGYFLYRLTAHIERLPFPMAPVDALGVRALAEVHDVDERWRWRWFSMGGAMGLVFGFVYVGIPSITGAILTDPVQIIPIPFLDLTDKISTREFMPATPLNLVFDVTLVIVGMVLPFWAVVGGLIGLIATWLLNPILYQQGVLTTWQPGMGLVETIYSNHVDFYLSFGIGLALAIFVVSVVPIVFKVVRRRAESDASRVPLRERWNRITHRDRDRGDISIYLSLGIYVFSTFTFIGVCRWLMPDFPILFFLGFSFIYTPVISYVNAKLEGTVGQAVQIPLVREAAFIMSGYTGSKIWFAPVPMGDYGTATRQFRVLELTGTKLTSVIKTELVVIPVIVVMSFLFSEFIWRLAPIPSAKYPFAEKLWELQAMNFALTASATAEGSSPFIEALKPAVISWGLGAGVVAFVVLSILNMPTFLVYGVVRGLGQSTPGAVLPEMIGALLGRYWLQKKYGAKRYKQYVAVLLAGFTAGIGLIGMASVGFALIAKSTSTLGY